MEYKRGQKLKHPQHGICYYLGKSYRGLAIVEIRKNGKFIDRTLVKFSNLAIVD